MSELTALAIEKLKPSSSRREVPDGKQQGLYLVVQPSGAKSWAFRYRVGGAPKKLTIGGYPGIDLKEARKRAAQAYVASQDQRDPAAEKKADRAASKAKVVADRGLVEKVVDQFIKRHVKPNNRATTAAEAERVLKKEVVGRWKGRMLASIGRADVRDMLDEIVDRGSPILANRLLAVFRKLCNWSVERGIIETSPCEKVKAPSVERSRDRVLSDDELRATWSACDKLDWPFGPMFRLLILSGQRRNEVAHMRWEEVDLDGKLWTIPRERAKNDAAHAVPLSPAALAILQALPRVGPYVFSTNGKTPVAGFSKAKERIDRLLVRKVDGEDVSPPRWTLHDFRRTAATGMARLGIGLPVIEKVLNHVSGSFGGIVGVYQRHSFADEKRHAVEAWGGFVERLAAGASNVVSLKRIQDA